MFVIRLEDISQNKSTLFSTGAKVENLAVWLGHFFICAVRTFWLRSTEGLTCNDAEADSMKNKKIVSQSERVFAFFDAILIFFGVQLLRLPILVGAGCFTRLFLGKEQ